MLELGGTFEDLLCFLDFCIVLKFSAIKNFLRVFEQHFPSASPESLGWRKTGEAVQLSMLGLGGRSSVSWAPKTNPSPWFPVAIALSYAPSSPCPEWVVYKTLKI